MVLRLRLSHAGRTRLLYCFGRLPKGGPRACASQVVQAAGQQAAPGGAGVGVGGGGGHAMGWIVCTLAAVSAKGQVVAVGCAGRVSNMFRVASSMVWYVPTYAHPHAPYSSSVASVAGRLVGGWVGKYLALALRPHVLAQRLGWPAVSDAAATAVLLLRCCCRCS